MQKKLLVNIDFNKRVYDNITNKNFVWCCDLLILKNYKEFEKILKREYLSMDNGIIVIDVVNSNDVEHFKYILDYVEIYDIERVLFYCLPKGLFNIVDYILNNNPEFDKYEKYINVSLKSNSLEFYNKYIKKCKDFNYDQFFLSVVKTGNIKFVKKFIGKFNHIAALVLYNATIHGNIELIKYLVDNKDKLGRQNYVIYGAVINGNIKNIEYLLQKGYTFNIDNTDSEFNPAILTNNYEILDWLLKNGCKFGASTFNISTSKGNIKIMNWVLTHGGNFDDMTFNEAIQYGNIKNLDWLVENGCKIIKNAQRYNTSSNWKEIQIWCENNNMDKLSLRAQHNNIITHGNCKEIKKLTDILPFMSLYFNALIKNSKIDNIKLLRYYINNKKKLEVQRNLYKKGTFNIAVKHGDITILKLMLLYGLEYKYTNNVYGNMYGYNVNNVNPVLRKQIKNILKDFLKENNIKIYE